MTEMRTVCAFDAGIAKDIWKPTALSEDSLKALTTFLKRHPIDKRTQLSKHFSPILDNCNKLTSFPVRTGLTALDDAGKRLRLVTSHLQAAVAFLRRIASTSVDEDAFVLSRMYRIDTSALPRSLSIYLPPTPVVSSIDSNFRVELGPYRVVVTCSSSGSFSFRVFGAPGSMSRKGHIHPHVQEGGVMCTGEFGDFMQNVLGAGDFVSWVTTIHQVLMSNNATSEYAGPFLWGLRTCAHCRASYAEMHTCGVCGVSACKSCVSICGNSHCVCAACGVVRCSKCSSRLCSLCGDVPSSFGNCSICGNLLCANHLLRSPSTGAAACDSCMTLCEGCQAYELKAEMRGNLCVRCEEIVSPSTALRPVSPAPAGSVIPPAARVGDG